MTILKKLLSLFLATLFIISINGCKSEESDTPTDPTSSSLVGTWVLTKITIVNGASSIILTPAQAGVQSTIIAKADGTYTATVVDQGVSSTESGTYSTDGTKITFKLQDGTSRTTDYSLSGNKLVVSQSITTPLGANTPANLEFTKQ